MPDLGTGSPQRRHLRTMVATALNIEAGELLGWPPEGLRPELWLEISVLSRWLQAVLSPNGNNCECARNYGTVTTTRLGALLHSPDPLDCETCAAQPCGEMPNDCFRCGDPTQLVLAFAIEDVQVLVRLCDSCAAKQGVTYELLQSLSL